MICWSCLAKARVALFCDNEKVSWPLCEDADVERKGPFPRLIRLTREKTREEN